MTHTHTLTRQSAHSNNQGFHNSIESDGRADDGHAAGDVGLHLLLGGGAEGEPGQRARLPQVHQQQEEWKRFAVKGTKGESQKQLSWGRKGKVRNNCHGDKRGKSETAVKGTKQESRKQCWKTTTVVGYKVNPIKTYICSFAMQRKTLWL